MKALNFCCFLLAVVTIFGCGDNSPKSKELQSAGNNVRLYAIRYGVSGFSTKELFAEPEEIKNVPFHWLFYLIISPEKKILVDTGFYQEQFRNLFGISLENPDAILTRMGYPPKSITDVILTHGHFDHIGGVVKYPEARIHITKKAFNVIQSQKQLPEVRRFLKESQHVTQYDGSYALDENIFIQEIGGHSPGSCVVYINLDGEKILLTGDEAYVDENIIDKKPVGSAVDPAANKRFIEQAAESKIRFFTFHSPNVVKGEESWREIKKAK
ncbi:MAG: MBL fold metallo-hydrolase [Spirochaetales bacterium]|nr:MBL fold metallo-hydrolase [Spirochaetales bacterium]